VTRHKSPRVVKHWHLLKKMRRLIVSGDLSAHAAAVKLAKEHWRGLSKTQKACVHWFEDNYRKFRHELRRTEADIWKDQLEAWYEEIERDPKAALKNLVAYVMSLPLP
jgi:hypothetical protein